MSVACLSVVLCWRYVSGTVLCVVVSVVLVVLRRCGGDGMCGMSTVPVWRGRVGVWRVQSVRGGCTVIVC